jgi:hypothetical protein
MQPNFADEKATLRDNALTRVTPHLRYNYDIDIFIKRVPEIENTITW